MVRVRLFANFRERVGKGEVFLEAKNVRELLKKLVESYPTLRDLVFEGDTVKDYVRVAVNGRIVEDLSIELSEEDEVAVFPPFSGG